MILVLTLYLVLIYCIYRMVLQSGKVASLKHSKVYDKQKRRAEMKAASGRLTYLIMIIITIVLSLMLTILLGV